MNVLIFNKKWNLKETPDVSLVKELSNELKVSELFIQLCIQRGLHTKEEIEQFLHPDETGFHDPFTMFDMQKTCERIMLAIERAERITVYGDYDADGVTSTAIIVETLEMMGAAADFFIPNRFKEGYGPNKHAFQQLIENGTQLIITVDNGIAGHEAIHYAKEQEVDVIVSDHHELPETLPEAYTIIHPRHPEGKYPFGDLSGAGVALKMAAALLGELPVEFLELAAIGTVADLVSLTDENRTIVTFGLKILKETQRIGLHSLMRESELKPEDVDETSIGFKIAPLLNALGRLGEAAPAVELFSTFDEERAQELAVYIRTKNEERKAIVSEIAAEALEQIKMMDPSASVYILAKEGWHEGVLGIVASRIVNETGKPAIVLNIDPETGEAKGSGRSIQAFNLFEAGSEMRELFIHFGGHHMAAGMTLHTDNIETLREMLNKKAELIQHEMDFADQIDIDVECAISDITLEALAEIDQLRPFGTGNPKPTFQIKDVQALESRRIGADKSHLKLKVQQEQADLDVIAFSFGEMVDALKGNPTLSILGTLEINEWNGNRKPQLMLTDLKISGPILFDKRSSELTKDLFSIENAHYIFFHEKVYEKFAKAVPLSSQAQLIQSQEEAQSFFASQLIVFVDCPGTIDLIKETLSGNEEQIIYCSFYSIENCYLKGMPSRKEFSALYKFFATHQKINLREKGGELAKYLHLDTTILKFMIKVFLEAGFVTIEDEIVDSTIQPEKKDITETKIYQCRRKNIEAEEVLLYSSFKELTSTLRKWTSVHS